MITADVTMSPLLDELDGMIERIEGRGIMTLLGEMLEDYETEVFATRGLGKWPALDPDTITLKGSRRPLVETGNLLRELTNSHVNGDTVQVDAGDAFYAKFLREGRGSMPKRDAAPEPSSTRVQSWGQSLLGYIVTGSRRS